MGSKKKWLGNITFFVLILGLTFYALFHNEDPRLLLVLLDLASGWYWLAGIVLVLLFISCESLILRLLLKEVGLPRKPAHCLIYSFIGFFFSCITPAAGGGQPAQIYYMNKDGLDPGVTAPVLVVVTICYKLVLVFFGILVAIVRPIPAGTFGDGALLWCILGWLMNIAAVTVFLMTILMPNVVEAVLRFLMKKALRFLPAHRVDRWYRKLEDSISQYKTVTSCFQKNTKLFLMVILISIVQRTLMFSITWLVLRSFWIKSASLLTVITMQAMVSLGTDMLPLPGGSGANEALFLLLFEGICGEALVLPVLLVTRGICYYGQFLICGIMYLLFGTRLGKSKQ